MYQVEELNKELKRLASIKSRLKKQMGKPSFVEDMQKVIDQENKLKEVRASLNVQPKTVTQFTHEDIQELDYEQVTRAIKSIQSKKSNSRWLTTVEGDNDEYRKACRIERMLKDRRSELIPTGTSLKIDIQNVLSQANELSKEELIAAIQDLL